MHFDSDELLDGRRVSRVKLLRTVDTVLYRNFWFDSALPLPEKPAITALCFSNSYASRGGSIHIIIINPCKPYLSASATAPHPLGRRKAD
jgi:hypothetical protein